MGYYDVLLDYCREITEITQETTNHINVGLRVRIVL